MTDSISVVTNITKLGTSNVVIIPKPFLEFFNLNTKDKVEVIRENDCLSIKPLPKWSAKQQKNIVEDIISFAGSREDDELLGEDFIEKYCHEQDDFDMSLFDEVRNENE